MFAADCSSDAVPEVRIVTPPVYGKIRLQNVTIPIDRPVTSALGHCNGKPIDAVGVFYKSKSGLTGVDSVVLDVDSRHGKVSRYIYNITVR